jgi:DNA polymerase V
MSTSPLFALVDCNNFFVSCERVFRPDLENKPVAVLSNNDGCFVSRSDEVKKLGIPMAAPLFKYQQDVKNSGVYLFSSNFSLYGDMSARVMQVLEQFGPGLEIYSIDEAFLDISNIRLNTWGCSSLRDFALKIKNQVLQWTGIPVSIGIGKTKTLAKLANEYAKQNKHYSKGVFDLSESKFPDLILETLGVCDVWGIGWRYGKKLHSYGILTALDLKNADDSWVLKEMTISGLRTVWELRGRACYRTDCAPSAAKSVLHSRTFVRGVSDLKSLEEILARFGASLAGKLRSQRQCAGYISVFLRTNRHHQTKNYSPSLGTVIEEATADSSILISIAKGLLREIYKKRYEFKRAGIVVTGLVDEKLVQKNLYAKSYGLGKEVLQTVDDLNQKYGRGKVGFAAEGTRDQFTTQQSLRSPRYTTNWKELLEVR